MKMKRWRRW